jgi:23S rRNA 5-hydroxycytidine C2501 synthase
MKNPIIELLSPARNLIQGKIAIRFGADAVYMGGPAFSARAAAGNSLKDIEDMAGFAHRYHARLYVALNTIIYESELEKAQKLIHEIWQAGADALIIQDMGIAEMDLPPIPLHVSTQGHNTDVEKIKFYESIGFERVILARELNMDQIRQINDAVSIETEVFVHGALCVSYSGQCYLSAAMGNRSANRGECAQPCRLPWTLRDRDENVIKQESHVLSLKDMNRAEYIDKLIDAGVSAFKIEGRLKDEYYVKNVTAYYRKILDDIFSEKPMHKKSSAGTFIFGFTPDPDRSFNRQFTDYFIDGRKEGMMSVSPSSVGKKIGSVVSSGPGYMDVDLIEEIVPGDGLCFFLEDTMNGFYVQKTEGNRLFTDDLLICPGGTELFRNFDKNFSKMLSHLDNARFIETDLVFEEIPEGFRLTAFVENGLYSFGKSIKCEKQAARDIEKAEQSLKQQLQKAGGTEFVIGNVELKQSTQWFLPLGVINALRRDVLDGLGQMLGSKYSRRHKEIEKNDAPFIAANLEYTGNISNSLAEAFYGRHGVKIIEKAFELQSDLSGKTVMTTKMCLRYNAGMCKRFQNSSETTWPQTLEYQGNRFRIEYDCDECVMKIIQE